MSDKLEKILDRIKREIENHVRDQKTGVVAVSVNLSQGGIGDSEISWKEKIRLN